jgi:uncharacterized protein YdeI (YjbR/CyaY-like superfamily)
MGDEAESKDGLPVLAFADAAVMEAWLERHGGEAPGFWLRLFKAGSGVASVAKAEAIDAALCFGWIDGQLDKYDAASWLIRFTPRKARSKWSEVNAKRAEVLIAAGRMRRCRPISRRRSMPARPPPPSSRR